MRIDWREVTLLLSQECRVTTLSWREPQVIVAVSGLLFDPTSITVYMSDCGSLLCCSYYLSICYRNNAPRACKCHCMLLLVPNESIVSLLALQPGTTTSQSPNFLTPLTSLPLPMCVPSLLIKLKMTWIMDLQGFAI